MRYFLFVQVQGNIIYNQPRWIYLFQMIQSWVTHIAQNIAETCQKQFQSFSATEIFSQNFFQILQNKLSEHYSFNFLKYFWKQINIQQF